MKNIPYSGTINSKYGIVSRIIVLAHRLAFKEARNNMEIEKNTYCLRKYYI